jgi:hypothetical protein
MVSKKGYFFVIDAIIASSILLFGLFILFGSSIRVPEDRQPLVTTEDFTSILLYQPLSSSTNEYYTRVLLPGQNLVINQDATPLEEIGYLVYRYNQTNDPVYLRHAENFASSIMNESLERRYGASIYLNKTLVFNRTLQRNSFQFSRITVVYIRTNNTNVIGPVLAEVQLWS